MTYLNVSGLKWKTVSSAGATIGRLVFFPGAATSKLAEGDAFRAITGMTGSALRCAEV